MKSRYVVGILLVLIAMLYLPFLGNAFVSDDIAGIVLAGPHWTWLSAIGWPGVIHIGGLLQYILYSFFGAVPWPYRLINILFHMGNVVLVWLVVRKHAKARVALAAALLFAIHPLAIESVTWISGGVYAFYTFFFLFSLYWYRNTSPVKRIFSIVFFVLSLLLSEKAVSLLFLFGLYEWMFGAVKQNWKNWLPYGAVTALFILFYITRLPMRVAGVGATGLFNPLLQVPLAISSYIELFLWPQHLTLYHMGIVHSWTEMSVRMAVTIVFFVGTVFGIVRKKPWGFWLAWVVIALGITLLPVKIAWIVAERYVYLGYIGFCVVVAMLFDRILVKKKWQVVWMSLGMFIVLLLCIRTVVRNFEWVSEDSLWTATLRESPEDPHSWNNMGDVYSRHGELQQSLDSFTEATKLDSNYADAYHNIGNTYIQMKDYDAAIPFFQKAVSLNPNLWQSYQDLAGIAVEKGNNSQALDYIEKALKIDPTNQTLKENEQMLQRATIHQ